MATNIESLDTNIILRLLLDDVPFQTTKAKKLLTKPRTQFYIDDVAILEAIFVLEKQLKQSRSTIAKRLHTLFLYPMLSFDRPLLSEIIPFWQCHPALSWADCYLAAKTAAKQAEPLWTFDRKFAKESPTAKELK